MSEYKTSKEAFVSGMTGSSVGHINLISLTSLVSLIPFCHTLAYFSQNRPSPDIYSTLLCSVYSPVTITSIDPILHRLWVTRDPDLTFRDRVRKSARIALSPSSCPDRPSALVFLSLRNRNTTPIKPYACSQSANLPDPSFTIVTPRRQAQTSGRTIPKSSRKCIPFSRRSGPSICASRSCIDNVPRAHAPANLHMHSCRRLSCLSSLARQMRDIWRIFGTHTCCTMYDVTY